MVGRGDDARSRPRARVFVRGEHWRARADEPRSRARERVEVVAVDGLELRVRRAPPES